MSNPIAPQYADLEIEFDDLEFDTDPSTIDLTAVDDIIFSISAGTPTAEPILILKNSTSPGNFTIDNAAKSVIVSVTGPQVTNTLGKYCTNLWIVSGGAYLTHLTTFFVVKPSVKYFP